MLRSLEPQALKIHTQLKPDVKKWLEEERKGKKTIVIVGFAPTSRALAPYDNDDPNIEIWGVNEAYRHGFMENSDGEFVADRWFQIHKPWSYQREHNKNHPNHWKWLQNIDGVCLECKGKGKIKEKDCVDCDGTGTYAPKNRLDMPIYMQEVDPDVPGSVKYPLDEIMDEYINGVIRGKERVEYFTSSFAYMCALAMYLNKDNLENLRIEVYGFEMGTETEYHYQKGSTEFWMGLALGHGVEIYLPEDCQLLKGSKYGFEVTQMINRQELEFRKRQLEKVENEKVAALNQVSGRRTEIEREVSRIQDELGKLQIRYDAKATEHLETLIKDRQETLQRLLEERQELVTKEINALSEANAVAGAMQEISGLILYIDAQYHFEDEAEMPVRVPVPSVGPKGGEPDGERS